MNGRQRARRERAARWAEFLVIAGISGFIALVWLFGVCCGFAIVEAAWQSVLTGATLV